MKKWLWALLVLFVIPIAFGVEVNSTTEIYTFNVTDCQTNVSSVGCGEAWIRFNCSITNYGYIDYAEFEIDSVEYEADRLNSHFYYDYYKPVTTVDTSSVIEWEKVKIYDVSDGIAQYFPNIEVDLICDACTYNVSYGYCNSSDQRIAHYVGDGSANCTSFNQTESCDYCIPDWIITSECLENNTEFRTYEDSNLCYYSTGLYSDSCDYEYTNCDSWIACSFLGGDLECGYDSNPLIEIAGNRIFWECTLEDTEDYSCISYVRESGYTIQTNPQQKTYSAGLFTKEQETREFFTATNGLVNPYFTTDNLRNNVTYIFGVKCSSEIGQFSTEHYVTPLYQDLDVVASRSVWVKNNLGYVLGGFIFIILVMVIISLVVKK